MAEVSLHKIEKQYPGGVSAVHNLTLDIADKEFLVLTGPSGSGKSTVLRIIAGMEEVSSGEVTIDGVPMNGIPAKNRDVAIVFESSALYHHMTVFDNLAFVLKHLNMPREEMRRRVYAAAEIMELTHLLERKPGAISAIQRQRVIIGRAVVRQPKVYLFDEPLSALDPKLCAQMRAELIRLYERLDATIIYATTDPMDALRIGKRVAVLSNGVLQQIGAPEELSRYPENVFVADFLSEQPISLVAAVLSEQPDGMALDFAEELVFLPETVAEKVRAFAGKEVLAGVHPDYIHCVPADTAGAVKATVEDVELVGEQQFFRCETAGYTLMVAAQELLEVGDTLTVKVDWSQVYLFDRLTRTTILHP